MTQRDSRGDPKAHGRLTRSARSSPGWPRLGTDWREGDLLVRVVFGAGYDVIRLACLLAGLPVELLGRLRGDRSAAGGIPCRVLVAVGSYDRLAWI